MFNIKNIPNFLTILRIILIPSIIICIEADNYNYNWTALILYIFACFSDFFDGYLARKFNNVSNLGRVFDPIADKMTIILLLCFFLANYLNKSDDLLIGIILILIITREILVSGLREFLGPKGKELRVTQLAKWKTLIQTCMIIILFLDQVYYFSDNLIINAIHFFCLLTCFITWYTGFGYIKGGLASVEND